MSGDSSPRQRTRFVLHRAGWASAIAFLPLLLLAWQWGWQEAAALAVLILVAFGIGLVVVLRPVNFSVAMRVPQRRVVVGRMCVAELVVTPKGRAGSSPAVVELPVGDFTAAFLVPRIPPGKQWSEPFLIPTERRQVLRIGPARAHRSDALRLLSRDTLLSGEQRVFVHPRTELSGYHATGLLRDLEGVRSERHSPSDVAFYALRDYQPGDDRRHVHWPTTARRGSLVVRQFEETRRSFHLVIVDARPSSYQLADGRGERYGVRRPFGAARPRHDGATPLASEAAELAFSIAASYGVEALMLDRGLRLVVGEQALAATSPTRLLDEITQAELAPDQPDLAHCVHRAMQQAPQASAVTIITGTHAAETELRRAVAVTSLSARVMVLRCREHGNSYRGQLDRATVFTVAQLAQLRRIGRVMQQ